MRSIVIAAWLAVCSLTAVPASAAVGVSIGINLPIYPRLVAVPGYPVYYAPDVDGNYFFYDGVYWVFDGVNWYDSRWYNGPWTLVDPFYVPAFILRVPVRYYHRPPVFFRGWRADYAPRWHEHWGRNWGARRGDWERWDHRTAPRAAPLPTYQQRFSGNNYPGAAQQAQIHSQNYRYMPREEIVRQHYEQRAEPRQEQRQEQRQDQRQERRDERRGERQR